MTILVILEKKIIILRSKPGKIDLRLTLKILNDNVENCQQETLQGLENRKHSSNCFAWQVYTLECTAG